MYINNFVKVGGMITDYADGVKVCGIVDTEMGHPKLQKNIDQFVRWCKGRWNFFRLLKNDFNTSGLFFEKEF